MSAARLSPKGQEGAKTEARDSKTEEKTCSLQTVYEKELARAQARISGHSLPNLRLALAHFHKALEALETLNQDQSRVAETIALRQKIAHYAFLKSKPLLAQTALFRALYDAKKTSRETDQQALNQTWDRLKKKMLFKNLPYTSHADIKAEEAPKRLMHLALNTASVVSEEFAHLYATEERLNKLSRSPAPRSEYHRIIMQACDLYLEGDYQQALELLDLFVLSYDKKALQYPLRLEKEGESTLAFLKAMKLSNRRIASLLFMIIDMLLSRAFETAAAEEEIFENALHLLLSILEMPHISFDGVETQAKLNYHLLLMTMLSPEKSPDVIPLHRQILKYSASFEGFSDLLSHLPTAALSDEKNPELYLPVSTAIRHSVLFQQQPEQTAAADAKTEAPPPELPRKRSLSPSGGQE